MYITNLSLKNIRSLRSITWKIEPNQCAGWHVIIGDNGSGKSTFLKAISLVLIFNQFDALRQDKNEWLNRNAENGSKYRTKKIETAEKRGGVLEKD